MQNRDLMNHYEILMQIPHPWKNRVKCYLEWKSAIKVQSKCANKTNGKRGQLV